MIARPLVSHPGKIGDCLWALWALQGLNEDYTLVLPARYEYLGTFWKQICPRIHTVMYLNEWTVQDTAPATPVDPPLAVDLALGYRSWPRWKLPWQAHVDLSLAAESRVITCPPPGPWLRTDPIRAFTYPRLIIHWTDRWFELKVGLTTLVSEALWHTIRPAWFAPPASRYIRESTGATATGLLNLAANIMSHPDNVVLTDSSAAMVLSVGLGRPVICMEPETDRHHDVFWPGRLGGNSLERWMPDERQPQDRYFADHLIPVLGTDGCPTFDARHVANSIEQTYIARREATRRNERSSYGTACS